jgi:hypothetical protein
MRMWARRSACSMPARRLATVEGMKADDMLLQQRSTESPSPRGGRHRQRRRLAEAIAERYGIHVVPVRG